MRASAYASGFRILARHHYPENKVEELVDAMRADAEKVERVPYHRHEEVFTFEDGSQLLYDHETQLGQVHI